MSRRRKPRKQLRILVMMHPDLVPPDSLEGHTEKEIFEWKTEYDVVSTLRALGHDARPVGLQDELLPLRQEVETWKPHIVFNLLEEFRGLRQFDQHVVSYLELLGAPYTGCNPRGLVLARDKSLAKKILAYHRVRSPGFAVVRRGRPVSKPRHLSYPLMVKSLTEEASLGIAQASIVESDEKLEERVRFIHESVSSDTIVEEYIEGRELYVGVIGNARLQVLPVWELSFDNMAPGAAAIATAKVKHDPEYQQKHGINDGPADLPAPVAEHIRRTSRRIYRALELDGYARIDYRLRPDGVLYFLEANPNPEIAKREEFAAASAKAGIKYERLIEKIVALGLRRGAV